MKEPVSLDEVDPVQDPIFYVRSWPTGSEIKGILQGPMDLVGHL